MAARPSASTSCASAASSRPAVARTVSLVARSLASVASSASWPRGGASRRHRRRRAGALGRAALLRGALLVERPPQLRALVAQPRLDEVARLARERRRVIRAVLGALDRRPLDLLEQLVVLDHLADGDLQLGRGRRQLLQELGHVGARPSRPSCPSCAACGTPRPSTSIVARHAGRLQLQRPVNRRLLSPMVLP